MTCQVTNYATSWVKDPSDNRNFSFDWADRLDEGDTIASSVWTCDDELVQGTDSFSGTITTIELGSGVCANAYECRNTIWTAAGHQLNVTCLMRVQQQ